MRPVPSTLAVAVACAMLLRPVAHGVAFGTVLVFWSTVFAMVVLPGALLCAGARLCPAADRWLLVGQGATIGIALHGVAFLAGRWTGIGGLPAAAAIVAAATGIGLMIRRDKRGGPTPEPPPAPPAASLTLAAALAGCILQPVTGVAAAGEPVPFDMLFHAGNAAELRHRWPLEDPRAAGLPLRYHLLAYALPVDAADRAMAPVADTLLGVAPLLWVALLALQVSNAGRLLFRDGRGGALAAAVVLLHADPGRLVGLGPGAFNSYFAAGVYGSPTTVSGFVLLAGITLSLERWLETGERRHLAAFSLLALAGGAAKTTLPPVVVGAAVLAAARALRSGRKSQAARWLAVAGLGLGCGLPLMLWQAGGEGSYSSIVHLAFARAFFDSSFTAAVSRLLGTQALAGPAAIFCFAVWLIGYLALGGIGATVWLLRRGERLHEVQAWALSVMLVGFVPAMLLDVPGLSQLFFAYDGQLLLALFAGAALARAAAEMRAPTALAAGSAALLFVAALPSVHNLLAAGPSMLQADVRSSRTSSATQREYVRALHWLRENHARDAIVFADNPSLFLSAFGEVRLYYENGAYTARGWKVNPGEEPWPERVAVRDRLLHGRDRAALAAARQAAGSWGRLVVVADNVPSRIESGWVLAAPRPVPLVRFFPQDLLTLQFANGSMQVYQEVAPATTLVR